MALRLRYFSFMWKMWNRNLSEPKTDVISGNWREANIDHVEIEKIELTYILEKVTAHSFSDMNFSIKVYEAFFHLEHHHSRCDRHQNYHANHKSYVILKHYELYIEIILHFFTTAENKMKIKLTLKMISPTGESCMGRFEKNVKSFH